MENDNQIAVKKRLIYAEDLFEPVDVNVLVVSKGGPSGGKTMAMYENLFRKRVEMAPTIDAVPVVHGRWIDMQEDDTTEGMWRCSVCGSDRYFDIMTPTECGCYYCPNCGAKMDLEEE